MSERKIEMLPGSRQSVGTILASMLDEHKGVTRGIVVGFTEDGQMFVEYCCNFHEMALAACRLIHLVNRDGPPEDY